MNKQKGANKIGWTEVFGEGSGATDNPIGGCFHDCQWIMPTTSNDDKILAQCYAGDVAIGVAQAAYPQGFRHHYWRPEKLTKWATVKQRRGVFVDSMSDMFGAWVPRDQILEVMSAAGVAYWHVFQSLTKNPKRLLNFIQDFPSNWWIGVSSPPNFMNGKEMSESDRRKMFINTLTVLHSIKMVRRNLIVWLSLEPITIDAGELMREYHDLTGFHVDWLIVGAASNGKAHYQPAPRLVTHVHEFADEHGIMVYHKENLEWDKIRREFPSVPEIKRSSEV